MSFSFTIKSLRTLTFTFGGLGPSAPSGQSKWPSEQEHSNKVKFCDS